MPCGRFNPETSVPVPTGAPFVVYSWIVPAFIFVMKISAPDTAMPKGPFSPEEISVPDPTGEPSVLYSFSELLKKPVPVVTRICA